jgi:hypothetical protein
MKQIVVILMVIVTCLSCAAPPVPVAPDNNNPVITNVSYAHDALARQDLELTCVAADADGDELKYEWAVESGQMNGNGPNAVWITPDTMGDYVIEVKVSDARGGVATQTLNVRILSNADGTTTPNVDLHLSSASTDAVPVKRTVKVGTRTRIKCIVDNQEKGELKYVWSKEGGFLRADPKAPQLDSGLCDTAFFTAPPNVGHYLITVVVEDQNRRQMKGQIDFDVFCCPRY